MHGPGLWGIIIVAVVVVVLFGRGKISGVMGEFASGIIAENLIAVQFHPEKSQSVGLTLLRNALAHLAPKA